jgi:hypothetical protein
MNVRLLLIMVPLSFLAAACAHDQIGQKKPDVVSGVIHGAWSPANPAPSPALPRGMYEGEYIHGFEVSAFVSCGSSDRWWAEGDLVAVTDFEKQHSDRTTSAGWAPGRLYVRVIATPSAAGNYGHLGSYPRRIEVHEVLEVREWKDSDCGWAHGA